MTFHYQSLKKYIKTILFFICLLLFPLPAYSLEPAQFDSYKLQFSNLQPVYDPTTATLSSPSSSLTQTPSLAQPATLGTTTSPTFIKPGFVFTNTVIPLTFTISELSLDFGQPELHTELSISHSLSIQALTTTGYTIFQHVDHPLQLTNTNISIPNSNFGFSLAANHSPQPLPLTPQPLIFTNQPLTNQDSHTIYYQLNLASDQPAGNYTNALFYTLIPNF